MRFMGGENPPHKKARRRKEEKENRVEGKPGFLEQQGEVEVI